MGKAGVKAVGHWEVPWPRVPNQRPFCPLWIASSMNEGKCCITPGAEQHPPAFLVEKLLPLFLGFKPGLAQQTLGSDSWFLSSAGCLFPLPHQLGWPCQRLWCCWAPLGRSPACFSWLLPGFTSLMPEFHTETWGRSHLKVLWLSSSQWEEWLPGGTLCFVLSLPSVFTSSQSSSFIKAAGRSEIGASHKHAPVPHWCQMTAVPQTDPQSAQGSGLLSWLPCRASSFHSSCFQEGEEIWTSLGEADAHLEKILGATFMWWFSGVSLRYHLSRRFAVPGNFRDVCFLPGLTMILVSHLEISSCDYSRIWKTFCNY